MTPPIPPALTPEEWADAIEGDSIAIGVEPPRSPLSADCHSPVTLTRACDDDEEGQIFSDCVQVFASEAPALIALLNAALPDDDPRKITREWGVRLRNAALKLESMSTDEGPPWAVRQAPELRAMAAALDSYLLPEGA